MFEALAATRTSETMNKIETNLKSLGVLLPDAPKPMGNFLPYLIEGSNLYISGQVSVDDRGNIIQGKLGEKIDLATCLLYTSPSPRDRG